MAPRASNLRRKAGRTAQDRFPTAVREQHDPTRRQPGNLQDDLQRSFERPGQVQLFRGNRLGDRDRGPELVVALEKWAIVSLAVPADLVQLRRDGVEGVPQVAGYRFVASRSLLPPSCSAGLLCLGSVQRLSGVLPGGETLTAIQRY